MMCKAPSPIPHINNVSKLINFIKILSQIITKFGFMYTINHMYINMYIFKTF